MLVCFSIYTTITRETTNEWLFSPLSVLCNVLKDNGNEQIHIKTYFGSVSILFPFFLYSWFFTTTHIGSYVIRILPAIQWKYVRLHFIQPGLRV